MPNIKPNTSKRKMTITRRPILIVVVILAIALIALIVAKILTNNAADGEDQSDSTTSEVATQTEALGTTEESTPTPTTTDADYNNPQTPKQYEGDNANTYSTLTGAITYAEVNNNQFDVRLTIDQELSNTGTCTLTATNGNNTITKTTGIINNPSSSSCDGFSIPVSELSSGTWQLSVEVNADGKSGTITGEVNI